ncbi:MAG: hypothetical protein QOD32_3638 [Pyrinomonadaceae bacterium]|jgi:hypothetical protein|nr:hypothetical protein [Pyrinomonadaceae bacterium]
MINLHTGEQTYVARLRVTGDTGLDPLAARLRLASLFAAAEVQPAGLAPSAIVCIRRLDDPRPRTVSLAGGHLTLPPEWQQSVRASIEQLARRAPRPARETVGADAPCVVFADRAELLAALACDWCEQRAATRWWWRSLFQGTPDADALVKLWRETPEYVPGALEHLARRHAAVPFARALAPDAARAILHSLTRRFALNELHTAFSHAPHTPSRAESGVRSDAPLKIFTDDTTREDFQLNLQTLDVGDAPWQSFAPEASSGELELPQQLLLGVGLALQRAPALARSRGFALRVGAWVNAISTGRRTDAPAPPAVNAKATRGTNAPPPDSASQPDPAATRDTFQEQRVGRASRPISAFDGARDPASETSGAGVDAAGIERADAAATSTTISSPDAETGAQVETTQIAAGDDNASSALTGESVESVAPEIEAHAAHDGSARVGETLETRVEEQEANAPPASLNEAETTHAASPLLEAQIETRFGGLFHLVNLALFLELYGDFTAPAAPGIALPIWDFAALLGRRMCGAGVESDAVWPLLARLAGREVAQPPGEGFHPPDAWRVPDAWLRTFPATGDWRWTISRRDARVQSRLQVIHPAKFLVLDVPLDSEAEAEIELARELEVYAGAFAAPPARDARPIKLQRAARPLKLRGRTPLARWVECVHLYTRARLRLALGTNDARRAARLLCERHARVFVTATHVDVVMRLAELPFEVRVAGLDRDPGWIPAAGRVVAFHFE